MRNARFAIASALELSAAVSGNSHMANWKRKVHGIRIVSGLGALLCGPRSPWWFPGATWTYTERLLRNQTGSLTDRLERFHCFPTCSACLFFVFCFSFGWCWRFGALCVCLAHCVLISEQWICNELSIFTWKVNQIRRALRRRFQCEIKRHLAVRHPV